MLLFTFQDEATGKLVDTIAPNEATARLRLVGKWTDSEGAPRWGQPAAIGDLPKIIKEAQQDERAAHAAVMAANPMGKGSYTSPEKLKAFTDAGTAHRKAQARVRALIELDLNYGAAAGTLTASPVGPRPLGCPIHVSQRCPSTDSVRIESSPRPHASTGRERVPFVTAGTPRLGVRPGMAKGARRWLRPDAREGRKWVQRLEVPAVTVSSCPPD